MKGMRMEWKVLEDTTKEWDGRQHALWSTSCEYTYCSNRPQCNNKWWNAVDREKVYTTLYIMVYVAAFTAPLRSESTTKQIEPLRPQHINDQINVPWRNEQKQTLRRFWCRKKTNSPQILNHHGKEDKKEKKKTCDDAITPPKQLDDG